MDQTTVGAGSWPAGIFAFTLLSKNCLPPAPLLAHRYVFPDMRDNRSGT
jgi:hypothetical protein